MVAVISVKIDGEDIHIFNSALYLFESSTGYALELDVIVSEITVNRYKKVETVITEIELEDGRIISSFMSVKILPGGLPQLNFISEQVDPLDYENLDRVDENSSWFPNIEEGITLEEIRKVEMPIEEVSLKLKLPIDQVEWLKKQNKKNINEMISTYIYENWKKRS
jgi:hypothetical protein